MMSDRSSNGSHSLPGVTAVHTVWSTALLHKYTCKTCVAYARMCMRHTNTCTQCTHGHIYAGTRHTSRTRLHSPEYQNKVGGGEGVEGCYGTLTRNGVQQIMEAMADVCGLSKDSILVDIGAGIGR